MEWWGTADYSAILTTPYALDVLDAVGVDRLRQRNAQVVHEGVGLVSQVVNLAPPRANSLSMAAVVLPSWLASDSATAEGLRRRIALEIGAEVMVTSVRGKAVLRLSAHAYNAREDFEKLAAYLEDLAR
jgi:selenocysteine lyase/cysteine desulfurase